MSNQRERELISKIIEIRRWLYKTGRQDKLAQKLLERDFNRLYQAVTYDKERFDNDLHYIIQHSTGINWNLTFGIEGGKPTIKVQLRN